MTKEEKIEFAKKIYSECEIAATRLESSRDDEIQADYFWIPEMRGPGGIIIGDNGEYLFCGSAYGYEHWKEEYKKGVRGDF